MRIRILVATVAARKCVKPGDEIEVGDAEGQLLVGIKKAERVASQEEADEAVASGEATIPPEAVVDAPPAEEVKEKKPKRKGKKHE